MASAAALLLGAIFPLGLAPFHLWPLSVLSCGLLSPLLLGQTPAIVFRRCLFYGVGLFGTGVSWVYISIRVHGGESAILAFLLTALFVLLLAMVFAAPFSLFGHLRRAGRGWQLAAFPAFWVLVEWFRGWVFTGFPWLYLGNGVIDTWLAGWAPVGGVLLLSLIASATGTVLVALTVSKTAKSALAVAGIIAIWLAGLPLREVEWTEKRTEQLSLAMIQPALTPGQKWSNDLLYDILMLLRNQSAPYWGKDLIIWPESAIPTPPQDIEPFIDFLDERAVESGTTLITGIPLRDDGRYYNSVILLGEDEGQYAKRHLVPFGEYLPFDSLLRGIIKFFNRPMSSFSPGADDQPLLTTRGLAIAAAICYEIVYQDLVSASAAGADMILTLSNDVWFGDSIGPHQHLQMARLRAIENAKPVVRSTNDGISAIIDHRGQITLTLPQFARTSGSGEVTPRSGHTPFNLWGSWPVVGVCLALLLAIHLTARRKKSQAAQ